MRYSLFCQYIILHRSWSHHCEQKCAICLLEQKIPLFNEQQGRNIFFCFTIKNLNTQKIKNICATSICSGKSFFFFLSVDCNCVIEPKTVIMRRENVKSLLEWNSVLNYCLLLQDYSHTHPHPAAYYSYPEHPETPRKWSPRASPAHTVRMINWTKEAQTAEQSRGFWTCVLLSFLGLHSCHDRGTKFWKPAGTATDSWGLAQTW